MKKSIIDVFENSFKEIEESLDNIKHGHNGPYNDEETLCRNYCHWLIILSTLYKYKQDIKYYKASYQIIDELKSSRFRPMSASYHCRSNPEKDFSNGLMGQAWVMEALLFANDVFADSSLLKLAEELYFIHHFDKKRSLWRVLNVDGSFSGFDKTFNHQLWFAAISSQIPNSAIKKDVSIFLDNVVNNVSIYSNGVIYHKSNIFRLFTELKNGPVQFVNYTMDYFFNLKSKRSLYSKSVGYHSFNLYAFSILEESFPEHSFYNSSKFDKISNVIFCRKYQEVLLKSKYSYPYNPPGYEEAVFLSKSTKNIKLALRAIQRNFDVSGGYNIKGVYDEHTSRARIYELARLNIDLTHKFLTVVE